MEVMAGEREAQGLCDLSLDLIDFSFFEISMA